MSTVLQEIVEKKHYSFIDGKDVTWQEAVRLSALPLVADGSVSEDYYKQIVSCIEKYGPYMVFEHNIAMPHTTENPVGAFKTGIGFMVSKELIDFGEDEDGEKKEANIFFTLSSVNSDEHMNNIQQLSQIFCNDELIDALAAARTPEDILAAQEKYPCEEED
ncbi:MAG: PTS sugar transporter subunit IIA [Lachnospiraceae bacterium]|nr:PTS sugar transporter subunit IIA [Lachnospiraceae bacterium]